MVFYEEKRDLNQSAGSGVGNAWERAEGDEASRGGRSGRKNRGKARVAPEDFFGHRKRGCKATSNPSFCATKKVTFVYRQRGLFSMISVPEGTGDISLI